MTKYIIIFFSFTIIHSCSKSTSSADNQNIVNPPSWLIGSWYFENQFLKNGYKFTNDNIIFLDSSRNEKGSYKDNIIAFKNQGYNPVTYEDIKNDSVYSCRVTDTRQGVLSQWRYIRVSPNTMKDVMSTGPTYTKL